MATGNKIYDAAQLTDDIATGKVTGTGIASAYDKIAASKMNQADAMGSFNFDFNKSPVFNNLKQSYMQQAQSAAQNAAAQAAARTGGYGNSYGTTAASQQYNQALGNLYATVPELEQNAYDRYNDRKNDLYTQASYYSGLADDAFQRYKENYGQLDYSSGKLYTEDGVIVNGVKYQLPADHVEDKTKYHYYMEQGKPYVEITYEDGTRVRRPYDRLVSEDGSSTYYINGSTSSGASTTSGTSGSSGSSQKSSTSSSKSSAASSKASTSNSTSTAGSKTQQAAATASAPSSIFAGAANVTQDELNKYLK